ncbi:stromal interaction molecule homolog isoform X2 [Cephus cinctus]|uniref:Stromal interaction molecule homolog isoform X2 n=1 Tax=Cephus cinctus TaxID=211228 RepID=A0AAJ7RPR6_CEPCN|nr:stromal interaction molecule homolog isoform X2 [Cephus cinctus]
MRVAITLIAVLRILCLFCGGVRASGGALDSGASFQSSTPPPKLPAFSSSLTDGLAQAVAHESGTETCNDDLACLTMASHDRLGLEAIKSLHSQLDDDANGNVDLSESDDFLREELQYEAGYERRQRAFHHNDDMHISVRELWEAWLRSEVHNWTIEQTSEWLTSNVELPQYVPTFIQHRITGATLPRLAVNNMHYLSNVLGIKDPIHKQKIALKAMDVVLFGPPKDSGHSLKDLVLITLLFGALIGCWYAYQQKKNSQKHLLRMMKDMESLHKAELALEDLQKELERARLEQESAATEKQNLEKRLQDESLGLHTSYSDLEVSQLKAEIEMLKMELQRAEGELEDRCWSPPVGLQHWLQLTHEIENKAYTKKKISAEKQLQQAREACEKLRKKRSSLVGAFVSTHGKSIDEVDKSIVDARTALNEVTAELQERVHRWKQIELLCGFNIINNNGRMSSQDDLDDEVSSVYSPTSTGSAAGSALFQRFQELHGRILQWKISKEFRVAATMPESFTWKESSVPPDSSGSETGKDTPPEAVHFTVGGDVTEEISPPVRPNPRDKAGMVRSYSQDTNMVIEERSSGLSKTSFSENSLDSSDSKRRSVRKSMKDLPTVYSVDDETLSTDSNSTADNDELKRRRRKLHFPGFRKNKSKLT